MANLSCSAAIDSRSEPPYGGARPWLSGSNPQAPTPDERDALAQALQEGRPFVHFRDGAQRQRLVTLPEGGAALSVGRGPWMEISLPWDDQVSRLHAQLEQVGGDWTIVDEALSRNGTFVNGERVTGRRRLNDGDELQFGSVSVTFRIPVAEDGDVTRIRAQPPS